jgi:hypothetical protein
VQRQTALDFLARYVDKVTEIDDTGVLPPLLSSHEDVEADPESHITGLLVPYRDRVYAEGLLDHVRRRCVSPPHHTRH